MKNVCRNFKPDLKISECPCQENLDSNYPESAYIEFFSLQAFVLLF